jgi:uncharacterized membrane protein YdjX (TVP38/TMEM64 family)
MLKKHRKKILLLCLLVCVGIFLQVSGALEPQKLISTVKGHADQWWLPVLLIALQILLFTFALAGSLFLWVTAALYPPLTATLILVAGATLGGISAYFFSARLTADWVQRVENSRTYKLLHKEDNFFTLFAMRVMPAFPQALINYSAGILHARLSHFILATMLGLAIKTYIFSRIIHSAATSASLEDLLDFATLAPLFALAVITALGVLVKHYMDKHRPA